MRFLTITCNPALDTTYVLEHLRPGAINRVDRALPAPGGKGNNVARVLAALGHAPVATGFAGGHIGRLIEDGLTVAGVRHAFVRVAGESRICLTVVEPGRDRITEIREPGLPITEAAAQQLLDRVSELAGETDVAIISGSMPPGLPATYYRLLIDLLKGAGVFVALDASGEALRLGVGARPDLVKPNVDELADLIGPLGPGADVAEAAHRRLLGPVLNESATVLLSLGAEGAAIIRRQRIARATAPSVTIVNTVGSGDALLAGYLDAQARGDADEEAIAHAVAVGTAAARQEAVGWVAVDEIAGLRQRVHTTAVNMGEGGRGASRVGTVTATSG